MRNPAVFLLLFFIILSFFLPSSVLAEQDSHESTDELSRLLDAPIRVVATAGEVFESVIFGLSNVIVPDARVPSRLGDDKAAESPFDITLIGSEELRRNGAQSLPEILQHKEGVTYSDETGLGLNARVDLRGFGGEAKQALVLFDGMRAVEPFDNSVAWHLYPLEYIDQVQIRRGAASTVYGEGAFSGVINLQTRNPTAENHVHAEAIGGQFDTEKYFVEASGSRGKLGLYTGARYATTKGYRVNSDHESVNTLIKAQYPAGDSIQIGNSLYFADNETGIPGPLSQAEVDRDRRQQDPDGQRGDQFSDRLVQEQLTVSAVNPEWGLELSNVLGYRNRDQDSVQTFGGSFGGKSTSDIDTETFSDVVQGVWAWERGSWKVDSTAGAEWFKDDILNPTAFNSFTFDPFTSERAVDRRSLGAFFQNDIRLYERWVLESGVRWDRIDWDIYDHRDPEAQKRKKADALTSRWGLLWKATDRLSIYGNYSESFKAPDANALIFETPNLFTPNPELDPQLARHYDLGLRGFHSSRGALRVNAFYIETKREILFNDLTNLNENFDTRRRGIEAALEWQVNKKTQGYVNYTHTLAEFDEGNFHGKAVPLTPRSHGSAGFWWEPAAGWFLMAQASAVYDQWALNDFNNIFPINDYWTLSAYAGYRWRGWECFVRAQNLLDEEYSSFVTSNAVDTVNLNPAPTSYLEFGLKWSG